MAKRKQSKSHSQRKVKRNASGAKVTQSERSSSPEPKTGAAAKVVAMFKRTAARIKEIEGAALSKLRGKGSGK